MKALVAALVSVIVASASPASAQTEQGMSLRPVVFVSEQWMTAEQTFKAIFGQSHELFWGGGLNITQDDQFYLELTASRFEKTGQRAFLNAGQVFSLGIPLTATLTPLEMTAGYRFHRRLPPRTRAAYRPGGPARVVPYLGGGVGLYRYKETSDFAISGDDVDVQHIGLIVEGGLEVRLARWIGIAGDVRYTRVPGILGNGGISKDAGEDDLGGIGARIKFVVGK
jgi:opacity protein-like surface antigen